LASTGHDDVGVHTGISVFNITKVEQGGAFHNACADCSNRVIEGIFLNLAVSNKLVYRDLSGHIGSGDGSGTGTAICLKDVTVDPERMTGELCEIDSSTECAADQTLDLNRAAICLALADIPRFAVERTVRKHRIFGCHPAAG